MLGSCCFVTTASGKMFVGIFENRDAESVHLTNVRAIHLPATTDPYHIAVNGKSTLDGCWLSPTMPGMLLFDVVEIILCTEEAQKSLIVVE